MSPFRAPRTCLLDSVAEMSLEFVSVAKAFPHAREILYREISSASNDKSGRQSVSHLF